MPIYGGPTSLRRAAPKDSDHTFEFIGACPEMTGPLIHYITAPGVSRRISYSTFAKHVDLSPLREQDHPALYRISAPSNWAISFWRSELPSGRRLYYFDWSRMEHLFVRDPETFDLEAEDALANRALYGSAARIEQADPLRYISEKTGLSKNAVLGVGAGLAVGAMALLSWSSTRPDDGVTDEGGEVFVPPGQERVLMPGVRLAHAQIKMNQRLTAFANKLRQTVPSALVPDLVIASGIRAASGQARAMLKVLESGGEAYFRGLYKQAAAELLALPSRTPEAWTVKVEELYRRRVLNPKGHFGGGALDIRASEMSLATREIVAQAAYANGAIKVLRETEPSPHLHIEIPTDG